MIPEPQDLIELAPDALESHPLFAALSEVAPERVWLANFSSAHTRHVYARAVGSFIATVGITTPDDLYSVKKAHVLAWRSAMEKEGLSQASIATRLAALSSLFRHLTDENLAASNPVTGVRRPKTGASGTGSGKTPTFSERQVRAMLDAPNPETSQGRRDRALLHIYFFLGARCSEPGRLRVKDFYYDAEFPVLKLTVKGNKENTIAINLECATAIRAYLDLEAHGRDPEAFLFQALRSGKPGQPLNRKTLYRVFDKYARQAGCDARAFPHMARSTFITDALEAGCSTEDVQRTVGHASITTTEGYNHTAKKHRNSASLRVKY